MNYELFKQINRWAGHSGLLDSIMVTISTSLPFVAVALLLYLWFIGDKKQIIENRHTALYVIFSSVAALIINAIIHFVYYHPRPFVTHQVNQLVSHVSDSSFVSDHAVLVFSIAWVVIMRNVNWKNLILIWAVFIGISRIYVGVHYPVDIVGSIILAYATSSLVIYFSSKMEPFVQILFQFYNQIIKITKLFIRKKANTN